MAISRIGSPITVVGTGTGGAPQTVTVPYANVSGSNVVAVLLCTARSSLNTYSISATIDAVAASLAVDRSGNLGGFGEGAAAIFYRIMGTMTNESGDAVFTMSGGDGAIGRIATLVFLEGVDQATPINDTNDTLFISGGTASSVIVNSDSTDWVLDCITFGGQPATTTPGIGQTLLNSTSNGGGNGDPTKQGTSEETGGSPTTAMTWSFSTSSFVAVAASFAEALVTGPTITQVTPSGGAGAIVRPNDKAILVTGSDFALPGITELWASKTTGFGDATKVGQSISSISNPTMMWDEPDIGPFELGIWYLFAVTDAGQPGEQVSAPFPILITNKDVRVGRASHVTDGNNTLQVVTDTLGFKPVACFINATGNTSLDTLQTHVSIYHGLVAQNNSAGVGAAARATGPVVRKRKQILGFESVFIMDPTSDAAADIIVADPILTENGMTLSFSSNVVGVHIECFFIGGRSAQAAVVDVTINDGSVSGLAFPPEFLVGISSNQTAGQTQDTTFARQSLGFCRGTGAGDQHFMATDMDSATRNIAIDEGIFIAQLNSTSPLTWAMTITALTADGFTWSGANGDNAYILALNLDGAQTFMDQWANTISVDGQEEDLPDSGIDNVGILVMTTAARTDTGPGGGGVGVRWATGVAFPDLAQSGATFLFLPATGTGTAEQHHSHTKILNNSSVSGSLSLEMTAIRVSRIPRIRYDDVPAAGILHNVLMIEDCNGDDEEGAWAHNE